MRKAFAIIELTGMCFSTMSMELGKIQAATVVSNDISGKENLIKNGNFDSNMTGWDSFTCEGAEGSVDLVNGALQATVENCGEVNYGLQVYNEG